MELGCAPVERGCAPVELGCAWVELGCALADFGCALVRLKCTLEQLLCTLGSSIWLPSHRECGYSFWSCICATMLRRNLQLCSAWRNQVETKSKMIGTNHLTMLSCHISIGKSFRPLSKLWTFCAANSTLCRKLWTFFAANSTICWKLLTFCGAKNYHAAKKNRRNIIHYAAILHVMECFSNLRCISKIHSSHLATAFEKLKIHNIQAPRPPLSRNWRFTTFKTLGHHFWWEIEDSQQSSHTATTFEKSKIHKIQAPQTLLSRNRLFITFKQRSHHFQKIEDSQQTRHLATSFKKSKIHNTQATWPLLWRN